MPRNRHLPLCLRRRQLPSDPQGISRHHGECGARTRYAASDGDGWSRGGEAIFPLTAAEARAWAEQHISEEDFERLFGAVSEDGDTVKTSFDLSPDLAAKLQDVAAERGVSRRAIIEELLRTL